MKRFPLLLFVYAILVTVLLLSVAPPALGSLLMLGLLLFLPSPTNYRCLFQSGLAAVPKKDRPLQL